MVIDNIISISNIRFLYFDNIYNGARCFRKPEDRSWRIGVSFFTGDEELCGFAYQFPKEDWLLNLIKTGTWVNFREINLIKTGTWVNIRQ